jgi:predicted TIM-barrel fold metal-dependent hydrolase
MTEAFVNEVIETGNDLDSIKNEYLIRKYSKQLKILQERLENEIIYSVDYPSEQATRGIQETRLKIEEVKDILKELK